MRESRASVSIELLCSIVIFGVVGIACVSASLQFSKHFFSLSPTRTLDSHIALLKIQNLLSDSINLTLSPTSVTFHLIDRQKLFGFGDKNFTNPRFSAQDSELLLPKVPLEILFTQGKTLHLASHLQAQSFVAGESLALLCLQQNAQGQVLAQANLAKITNASQDKLTLDSTPPQACKALLPLEQETMHLQYVDNKLFFNNELLLDSVQSFELKQVFLQDLSEFVVISFCRDSLCFEGGAFVNTNALVVEIP
ncbi:hypothetical protein CQA49_00560 [Helicobacter sp. MIT 00-7814]|uniref:hypothetical protein n=1 Tax=unclassified Helicobacter TaxID=2593540 RepID=UPI000E1F3A70|nr:MULTISPECIES: hypothetical protein [unclassified Helicobacter]RDU57189.1 hypothetical protein CQA49_00560 [Helicobacter sp. MIT 00-7814]RDU57741.1 hypothetical protein CQA37_00560 [Helicobacter sp. MIT 99-10781]